MENVVNLGLPHVGEQIFESIKTETLIQCLSVSQAWKILAENVLFKRWKDHLFEACEEGKAEIVRIILERSKPECLETQLKAKKRRCDNRYTALMMACINGHKGVVKLLLDHPYSDFNARDSSGRTAFMLAFERSQHSRKNKNMLKVLMNHQNSNRIDFNASDDYGRTPFIHACDHGLTSLVKLLLEHPNAKRIDFDTKNGLEGADECGHFKIMSLINEYLTEKKNSSPPKRFREMSYD